MATGSSDIPRLTEAQRLALRELLRSGDSDHLSFYSSRGLPSLERRGLVVQRGGRRPLGRGALRVLSAEGERVARLLAGQHAQSVTLRILAERRRED